MSLSFDKTIDGETGRIEYVEIFSPTIIPKEDLEESNYWINSITEDLVEHKNNLETLYKHFAVMVNGIFKSVEYYESDDWLKSGKFFTIRVKRILAHGDPNKPGVFPAEAIEPILVNESSKVAELHSNSIHFIVGSAITQLYSFLEDYIFSLHIWVIKSNPHILIRGRDDYSDLEGLYNNRTKSEQAKQEWDNRIDHLIGNWKRKKSYDGLHKIFDAFFNRILSLNQVRELSPFLEYARKYYYNCVYLLNLLRQSIVHNKDIIEREDVKEALKGLHSTGLVIDIKNTIGHLDNLVWEDVYWVEMIIVDIFDIVNKVMIFYNEQLQSEKFNES